MAGAKKAGGKKAYSIDTQRYGFEAIIKVKCESAEISRFDVGGIIRRVLEAEQPVTVGSVVMENISDLAGDVPGEIEVEILRVGQFQPTMCAVYPNVKAEFLVEDKAMSKRAMLEEIAKGAGPRVIPLLDNLRGKWDEVPLDTPYPGYERKEEIEDADDPFGDED